MKASSAMKQPAFGFVVLYLILFQCSFVSAVYTIRRNTQDCVWPLITAEAVRLWPTSSYLPRGNSIRTISGGGYLVDSTAGFSIEYYSTYKIVTNKLVNEKYLLYNCGTGKPDTAAASQVTKVFQLPLTSASVADATAADFMTQIVLMDRVAYAGELAVSGCLQAIAACGYVAASDPATSAIKDKVDSMWIYGSSWTAPDPMSISFNAVAATKPLERVKWLAYVAAFFNKEFAANAVYAQVRESYLSLRRDALAALGEPPLVCWVFKDWDGHYAMSFAPYKMEYVNDAGGQMYPIANLTASGMKPKPGFPDILIYEHTKDDAAESWAGVLSVCDVIVDESYEQSTGGLTNMDNESPDGFLQTHGVQAYATQIPAVVAKQVYTLAGTTGVTVTNPSSPVKGYIGLDWFERGVSRADEVLRDLVSVIRPSVQNPLLTGWKRRFLLRLDGVQQQVQTPAVCNLATAKLTNCVRGGYAARICPNAVRNCDTGVVEFPPLQQRCAAVSQQDRTRRRRRRQRPRVVECVRS